MKKIKEPFFDNLGLWRFNKGAEALFLTMLLALCNSLFTGVALAAAPDSVQFTLEGCRNNGTIALPDVNGQFICLHHRQPWKRLE